MSGGHWDHIGYRIEADLRTIAIDEAVQTDCPVLSEILEELGQVLHVMEHQLDWHYSGDSHIEDMAAFQAETLQALREAVSPIEKK